jgi:hypothetical protein
MINDTIILSADFGNDRLKLRLFLCGNKMPTTCNRCFLLQILLLAQHVSGTIMPIIRSSRVLYSWLLPVVFRALVFKLSVWCGAAGYVFGLRAAAKARKFLHLFYLRFYTGLCMKRQSLPKKRQQEEKKGEKVEE